MGSKVVTGFLTLFLVISYGYPHFLSSELAHHTKFFILLLTVQNVFWLLLFSKRHLISTRWLFLLAVLSFTLSRLENPLWENDYYRYFWDGVRVTQGEDPYALAPSLTSVPGFEDIKNRIGFGDRPTIYPVLAQVVFGLSAWLSGYQMKRFLWVLVAFGTLAFSIAFYRFLRMRLDRKRTIRLLPLVLIHPLIVREWYQACHYDVWMIAALLGGIVSSSLRGKAFWMAVATNFKPTGILGVLTFPYGLRRLAIGCCYFLFFLAVPWLLPQFSLPNFGTALLGFGKDWEMNSGLYRWIRELCYLTPVPVNTASILSRFMSLGVWALMLWGIRRRLRPEPVELIFWALFLLILAAPVANPWYFTWTLPFCFGLPEARRGKLLIAHALLPLSYAFYMEASPVALERLWDFEHLAIWMAIASCFISLKPGLRFMRRRSMARASNAGSQL